MRMFRVRTILFCLIGLMLGGLALGLVRFRDLKKNPEAVLALLPENSDVRLNNIHHVATRDGVREWTLDAESVRYKKSENISVFKDVIVTFFLKNGEAVQVTGNDAVLLTDTKNMEISGDVVVRNGSNQMETQRLLYDHDNRSIFTDTPIIVRADGIRLTGNNMVFSLANEQVTVWGDVDAVFENVSM